MSTPLETLHGLIDHIGYELDALTPESNPVIAQYQLACIRDLAFEMHSLSARLTRQFQDDAQKLTKKEDTNG